MNEGSNKFFDEMAEDFFAECDELLSVIKRDLFKLDNLRDQPADRAIIEELLRSCHTLKGLTGMVGADETMKLTHSIESYLKALNKGELSITREALDVIFRSIGMVESHVNALRNKVDRPDSSAVRKEVENLIVKGDPTAGKKNAIVDTDSESRDEDEKIWLFSFKPTHELFNKGININDIRNRINDLGRVISSKPKTDEAGRVTFEFLVATIKPESSFAQWTSEGITYISKDEISQNETEGTLIHEEAAKTDPGNVKLKNIVRVDITRLDNIMRSVGDLVISRSRLNENLKNMRPARDYDFDSLLEINVKMERQIRELRDGIMKLRLVNTGEAFERLRFVVRDLIKKSDKKIRLQFEGQETLIDKYVMDRMFDPLLHLVRNSVSHGIETPHERIATGKPGEGLLFIKASASGNAVIFEINDDGNGIDRDLIRRKAQNMGIIKKGHEPTDTELLDILCLPGFSTREKTDMTSGRGVGMEIVKKTIDEIGGSIILQSKKGTGTKFIIHLPLTLSIVDALIISTGKSHFALPMPFVSEIIKIDPADIISFQEHKMISYRNMAIPLLELHRLFNISNEGAAPEIALIIDHSPGKVGILIDRIMGQREIVVRSLADPIVKVNGISGVTDPGDGKALLILDVHSLIRSAFKSNQFAEEIYQHNEDGK